MTSAGESSKNEGNACFKAKDYAGAVKNFSAAIEAEPTNEAYYSNRSAAYVKLKKFDLALADGDKCVELKPEWGKGYTRQGSALFMKGEYAKAVSVYATGLARDPTNKILTQGLQNAQKALTEGAPQPKSKKTKKRKGKKGKDDEKAEDPPETSEEKVEHVIGIDLGTTNSCVGVWDGDNVTIIANQHGDRTIPSYVAFDGDKRLTGQAAKNQATRNPSNTVYDVKRIIGQRMSDSGVDQDVRRFPFAVKSDGDDKPIITVETEKGSTDFAVEEISALVLRTCKEVAETHLGAPVGKAVITVPAYFNDAQRNATKAAGLIAGLEVLRIINEPTAAALAYGLDRNATHEGSGQTVLVFDLGGGTFDVSVLKIESGVFTVLATGGDTRLGGEDFDNAVVDYLLLEAEKQGITDLKDDKRALQRLRVAAEGAKRELSNASTTEVRLDALAANKNFKYKITRAKFEQLNRSRFSMCLETVQKVLKDAKLKQDDINEIVLVGGSTRIPKIQEELATFFGKKVEDLCKAVNPDEAVAYGAAVQGAILNGSRNAKTENLLLMDVTPLSLGIETTGRIMSVVIPRNTPIPCAKTQVYTTESNYQTKVDVSVYEGERLRSDENNLLGEFTISGIESAKRGEPQIDVTFSLDSDGCLNVTAKDQKTQAEANVTIANRSKMSEEEIEKMVKDAEKFKAADEERMKKIESKNELEATIFQVLDIVSELEDPKLAKVLEEAANKDQVWLEENGETAKASELAMRRRNLSRRIDRYR